jgi:murein DD-endopeptidase MepM/ murein hydrolase activator NlpD
MASISRWGKFAIILYLFAVHLLALFFILDKINGKKNRDREPAGNTGIFADRADAGIGPADSAAVRPGHVPALNYTDIGADTGARMIPVAGVKREELQDTYSQARSGGRSHNAIDIMAAAGTPVVAVADGEIAKLFNSEQGGITIYQWSKDRKRVYYYAHLQRRAEGIAERAFVRRGTVIGYVGDTGNAGPGT